VGFLSFNLMVVHVVMIILGYVVVLSKGLWGTIVDLVVNYLGMLLVVVGMLVLVMVIVILIKVVRF